MIVQHISFISKHLEFWNIITINSQFAVFKQVKFFKKADYGLMLKLFSKAYSNFYGCFGLKHLKRVYEWRWIFNYD